MLVPLWHHRDGVKQLVNRARKFSLTRSQRRRGEENKKSLFFDENLWRSPIDKL
jgi:hypothetical protein